MEQRGLYSIPLPTEANDSCSSRMQCSPSGFALPGFFRNLKQDDIILLFLIILLLSEGNSCDYLLVGILIVIFIAGMDGNFLGL